MTDKELLEREEMLEDILDALEDKEYDEVEDMADEAIESFPDEAFGYFYMGEALFLQYDYQEAAYYFQHAVAKALNNSTYIARLALVNAKLDENEKAQILYRKVLEINNEHLGSILALAVYALNDGVYSEAETLLNKAINIAPDYAEAYQVRALLAQVQGNFQAALKDIDFLMQQSAANYALLQQKITVLSANNQPKAILTACQDWIAKYPEDARAYFTLAGFQMTQKSYSAAVASLDQHISLAKYGDFEVREAYLMRSWAYLYQNKTEEATASFKKSLSLNPGSVEAYIGLCDCMLAQQQQQAAISYLDIGISTLQEKAWKLAAKKIDLLLEANSYQAVAETVAILTDHQEEEVQGIGYFCLGNSLQKQGDLPEAYKAWRKASDLYHVQAEECIDTYCQEFVEQELKVKEGALLLDMQADFTQNAQSKVLQQFFTKFWAADVKLTASKNEMFAQVPAKMEKQILELLSNICVAIQPQGILVLNPGYDAVRMLYSIEASQKNAVTIKGIPLHAASEKEFEISWDGKNMLLKGFGDKDADIILYLQAVEQAQDWPKKAYDALKIYATAGELEYMGDAFNRSF